MDSERRQALATLAEMGVCPRLGFVSLSPSGVLSAYLFGYGIPGHHRVARCCKTERECLKRFEKNAVKFACAKASWHTFLMQVARECGWGSCKPDRSLGR